MWVCALCVYRESLIYPNLSTSTCISNFVHDQNHCVNESVMKRDVWVSYTDKYEKWKILDNRYNSHI